MQQASMQVLNYGSVLAMAFWVAPEVHGFFTLSTMSAGLSGVLGSMGIGELVVKDKSEDFESKLPGYWFLTLIVAGVLLLLSLVGALALAVFYADEYDFNRMFFYGTIMSLIAPIGPIRSIMEAVQARDMNFKQMSLVSVASFVLGIIPSFFLAAFGYEYWALGSKFLLPHIFYVPLGFWMYRQNTRIKFEPTVFHNIKSFSGYFTLNNLINYFVRNVDYLIIGKFFPALVLGQYTIAYKILLFPMKNVTSRIVQVGTPLLAKMNYHGKDFKRKYFLMVQSIAVIVLPIMLYLFLVSEPLVELSFSDGYELLPIMISYLTLLGAVQALVSPVGILYIFREDMKLMTANSLVALIVFTSGLLLSSITGTIETVLLVYALSYVVFLMPNSQYWIFRRYGFSMSDFGAAILPYLICCVPSLVITYLWLDRLSEGSPLWLLVSAGGLFVFAYYVALKLLNRWSVEERLYMSLFKRFGL